MPSIGLRVDVTDPDTISRSVEQLAGSDLPPVGAPANIAGLASPVPFLDVDLKLWHRVIDINLTGTFLMCQAYLPQMIENGYGRIVNMSSVSAQQGGGGVLQDALLRSQGRHPGSDSLPRAGAGRARHHRERGQPRCGRHRHPRRRHGRGERGPPAAAVPLKRQATPDDIAALFVWLSSEDSSYVTGGTHNINGGSYIA